MEPARWSAIEAAFEKAIALPHAERPAFFATLPLDIRDEVSELVLADSDSTALLHAVVDGAQAQLVPSPTQKFGPWHVTGKIGHGGMGAVYKVIRDDGAYSKTAALKILHLGLDSDVMLERFRQERQILAALEHPHIARLVDGGETADQVPYLVLEFVEGQSLTAYAAPLNQRVRLKLFLQVCEAVEYLHRNLIVHRDLKPSNILVTADGTAKLLDFGIAKLVDSNPARTMTSWLALTPNYASPEQVRGGAISTASDVYSLGVILYELLTGGRPYQIDTNTPLEIDRLVCQTAPPPPNLGSDLDNIILMPCGRRQTAAIAPSPNSPKTSNDSWPTVPFSPGPTRSPTAPGNSFAAIDSPSASRPSPSSPSPGRSECRWFKPNWPANGLTMSANSPPASWKSTTISPASPAA